ncbi:DsrE family protein [uncultured Maricaulis sp.]|uniref:DsrE family protein n=1 Tax=uncultured Maricaulis sp. TaxID=174710 RepID=UPI0030DD130B|tara:strand:- start:103155 stop:103694 length:540 start_codon:yes stop_codon:yes gene_type:complete
MKRFTILTALAAGGLFTAASLAAPEDFVTGPLIENFGAVAPIENQMPIPEDTVFRIAFDVSTPAEVGEINRKFNSAARFLNMHTAAGIAADDIQIAIVIHGGAVQDVSTGSHFTPGVQPANAELIATLLAHGVKIYVCGQSAAYHDIGVENLLPGVTMALSAMTAHALLQQDGYTLNPF